MSIRNKTKGVKMKKVALAVAVILGFVVVQPVQASNQKALVIIDSYFDSKVSAPNIKCITLTNTNCTNVVTVSNPSLSHAINHGNAMAEVAKKQSASVPIILLVSAAVSSKSVAEVNAGNFIDALNWVNANSNTVGAVSVSRFFNGNKACSPATTNTAPYGGVGKADQTIRSLIATLKSKNIPVFVATGNASDKDSKGAFKTKVDYPACIADTVSVTSPGNISDASTDVSGSLNTDSGVWNFNSPVLGPISQSTSSITVAVATQYLATGVFPGKVVRVNP
jgi:hypothetical protein